MEPLVTLDVVERVRSEQARTLAALDVVRASVERGSPDAVRQALEILGVQLSSTLDLMSAVLDALTPDEGRPERSGARGRPVGV
jgi:hypothetical protein